MEQTALERGVEDDFHHSMRLTRGILRGRDVHIGLDGRSRWDRRDLCPPRHRDHGAIPGDELARSSAGGTCQRYSPC